MMPGEIRTPCPKCGSEWVRIKHFKLYDSEYLKHSCEICGYAWREPTKDSGKERGT